MASIPPEPAWGIYDPRPIWDTRVYQIWDEGQRQLFYRPDGTVYSNTVVGRARVSMRPYYKKSPLVPIAGTSSKWRPPTAYKRFVYTQYTNQEGDWKEGNNRYLCALRTSEYMASLDSKRARYLNANTSTSWPNDDPEMDNIRSRAETQALLKFADYKVDLGTFLAESVKTADHLASTASSLYRSFIAVKQRDWKTVYRELIQGRNVKLPRELDRRLQRPHVVGQDISRRWLEYQYGWKPLMNDIKGIYDTLSAGLENALLLHAYSSASAEVDMSGISTGGTYGASRYVTSGVAKLKGRCKITGQLTATSARNAARVGLINPAAVAWELVPYSFAVDWAIPVGNVLQALNATRGTTFVGGCFTSLAFTKVKVSMTRTNASSSVKPTEGEALKYMMDRKVYSSYPTPSLYSKSPFSTSHVASALALLRQLV